MSDAVIASTGHYTPGSLRARVDEIEIIDVRTPGEFESVHMPTARNLPLDELGGRLDEVRALVDAGSEVVLSCRTQNRARQAQQVLAAAGMPGLPIVEGGIVAWEADGAPVVRGVLRWDMERQVRFTAGALVLVSILVSLVFPPARFVAGFVGAGLVFSALTNTCTMALGLAKLPYNRPPRG
ncbi:MAG: rhodanese-like domain-containing protein [Nitriliruptoraceae bacterium]